jgi:hypothetical protein
MLRSLAVFALLAALLIAGCQRDKPKEDSGGPGPAVEQSSATVQRPLPRSQTFYAAQQALKGAAAPGGAADPGRLLFDGDKRAAADLSAPPVSVASADGKSGKTVTYTAAARPDSLKVGEVPSPRAARLSSGAAAGVQAGRPSGLLASAKGPQAAAGGAGSQASSGDSSSAASRPRLAAAASQGCPEGMADIEGRFCIDRWEAVTIDRRTGAPLSPYYTPNPAQKWPGVAAQYKSWADKPSPRGYAMPELPEMEKSGIFEPAAVSKPGVYPQGFMNHALADLACRNAGKRLCTHDEWYRACVGPDGPRPAPGGPYPIAFPYGKTYDKGRCNFQVVAGHPLLIVGRSSSELDDPRLMLADKSGRRLLAKTGAFSDCTNDYGVYDMVGNQDEVIADMVGDHMVFVGSFYSRDQGGNPRGCASAISAHHASLYSDYSIGYRCCKDR